MPRSKHRKDHKKALQHRQVIEHIKATEAQTGRPKKVGKNKYKVSTTADIYASEPCGQTELIGHIDARETGKPETAKARIIIDTEGDAKRAQEYLDTVLPLPIDEEILRLAATPRRAGMSPQIEQMFLAGREFGKPESVKSQLIWTRERYHEKNEQASPESSSFS
jgi:CRISPR/Cas system-associated protein Cas7 (RAMP superfamily)